MDRIRISRNLEIGKYAILAIGIFLVGSLFFIHKDVRVILTSIFTLGVLGLLYYLFDNSKTVDFDKQYLFISNRKVNEKIPLNQIVTIKLTTIRINNDRVWKIKYLDNSGKKSSVRILPRRDSFEMFKKTIREKHESIKIKNWSSIIDFDQ